MAETYVAPTKGHEIVVNEQGGMRVSRPGMDFVAGFEPTELVSGRVQSLREFFRDERDKELGRWRDPKHPDLFAKQGNTANVVRVTDERNNERYRYYRDERYDTSGVPGAVAQAYFDAHPVKKPWHDAKPGEVWELQWKASDYVHSQPALVRNDGKFALRDSDCVNDSTELDDIRIKHAKRIYPTN